MMYVSGETVEPSTATTGMVEEIVRQQVIEMVSHIMNYSSASKCETLASNLSVYMMSHIDSHFHC